MLLSYVAEKEGVSAESYALHIIAQKSDGALRDALSIFDQIISFSGKKITYKNVIENLNVLDYDYFFKMTDFILDHNISGSIILINEIIDNGFDGQHFLIGFGQHLRDLLVCKDPETLKLLEVGGSIREKYGQQAQSASVQFLIRAIDINNKCDIEYKNSNNKKLHLELALLQMCSIESQQKTIRTSQPPAEKKRPDPTQKKGLPLKTDKKDDPLVRDGGSDNKPKKYYSSPGCSFN
jgi:DNA polymerase-3 subunit gamma/tau